MTTPPTPNPTIVMVNASDTSARVAANSRLHDRQHDHDRPHADAADGADQQHKPEPPPGGGRVGNEGGGGSGIGGMHGARTFVSRCLKIKHP